MGEIEVGEGGENRRQAGRREIEAGEENRKQGWWVREKWR